jgi:hypothetical protein
MKPLHENVIFDQINFKMTDSDRRSQDLIDNYVSRISDVEVYCIKTFGHSGHAIRWRYGEQFVLIVDEDGNYETDVRGTIDVRHVNQSTWLTDNLDHLREYVDGVPSLENIIHLCVSEQKDWMFWSLTARESGDDIVYADVFLLPDVHEVIKCKLMAN